MVYSYIDTKNIVVTKPVRLNIVVCLLILISLFYFSPKAFATSLINCSGMHENNNFQVQNIVIPVSAIDVEAGKHLPIGTVIYRQHFQPAIIPAFSWSCHLPNEEQTPFSVTAHANWLLSSSPYGVTISGLYPNIFQTNIPGVGVSIIVTEAMINYDTSLPGFVDKIVSTVCHHLKDRHCKGSIAPVNKGIEVVLIKIAPISLELENMVLADSFPSFVLEIKIIESLLAAQYVRLSFSGQVALSECPK